MSIFYIIENDALKPVSQAEYTHWYKEKGRFLTCKGVDLGHCNYMFGGYCGRKNDSVEDWQAFYLTYSWRDIDDLVFSTTEYFETYADLCWQYRHLLSLDWSEWDTLLVPGAFECDVEIADLYGI